MELGRRVFLGDLLADLVLWMVEREEDNVMEKGETTYAGSGLRGGGGGDLGADLLAGWDA